MKQQIIAFLFINLVFLALGFNLTQRNPEELFLSDESFQSLQADEKEFGPDKMIFVHGLTQDSAQKMKNEIEAIEGEFVSLEKLLPSVGAFKLPRMEDDKRFLFLEKLKEKGSNLHFAGMELINAHLAAMSIKIQQVLFPVIFSIMFLCLLFIFKNFTTTLYLFLTSFVGVSVGMASVKICFGYSTILTSLTPLVSFILTLASQMHVIFGINVFKTREQFFKHKLAPIIIMMVTTVIGFAGLCFSDLVSIRQFGIATTITLIVTWGCNLLFLSNFSLQFEDFKMARGKWFSHPRFRPWLGFFIIFSLLSGGMLAMRKMPILVEALYFFPESHEVRTGFKKIEESLGGTPQVDFVISKKDKSELSFEDQLALGGLEKSLIQDNLPYKILSVNKLLREANQLYTGSSELPQDKNAYLVMKGQLPEMIRNSLLTEHAYKISFLSTPMEEAQRIEALSLIRNQLKHLPPEFQVKVSGLNYLLLESQSQLVKTLITSLMGSFACILFIFAFFSRDVKEIGLFSLISLSSIFGGLLLMYFMGFSLNVSSVMTLSISIGLVDDSTIHLLYANKHKESEETVLRSCIIPMILSNVVLFFSFLILSFEAFVPIRQFALGLLATLLTGLILDMFVLPMVQQSKNKMLE